MLDNVQCKHIILGGVCHDNGYLRILEPVQHDQTVASKVTLLETFRTESGFYKLRDLYGFKMTKFASIFRQDPLPDKPRVLEKPQSPAVIATLPSRSQQPTPPLTSPSVTSIATIATTPAISPSPPLTRANTFAAIGGPAPAEKSISIAPTITPPRKFLFLNSNQERVDPPMQKVPQGDISALFARINKKKLCNEYFLRGKCFNKDVGSCDFDHDGKLSPNQLIALKNRTRRMACPMGTGCRDIGCYRGHICSFGEDCTAQLCPFDDHQHYLEVVSLRLGTLPVLLIPSILSDLPRNRFINISRMEPFNAMEYRCCGGNPVGRITHEIVLE
jgi:hypothetical protein